MKDETLREDPRKEPRPQTPEPLTDRAVEEASGGAFPPRPPRPSA